MRVVAAERYVFVEVERTEQRNGQIKALFQWVGDAYIFTLTTCIAIV